MSFINSTPSPEFVTSLKQTGFKVIKIEPDSRGYLEYTRRDFYKIAIVSGKVRVHQANEHYVFEGTYLRFSNPRLPYSSVVLSPEYEGYACFFTEVFLSLDRPSNHLRQSPLFRTDAVPGIKLNVVQARHIVEIFEKMLAEQQENYVYKADLIRSYIYLLIHEALKIELPTENVTYKKAPVRITRSFFELMEQQFPIVSPLQPLQLKKPKDFANELSIHINYLNRSVKATTGKTTSDHIAERVIYEAKSLMRQSNWSISEIAHSLGFEYANYFNSFFKKRTGKSPSSFRNLD